MRIYINGELTDPKRVGWNDHLNYGQMLRFQPNQIFNYVIVFSKSEFLEQFSEVFAEVASEFKIIDAEEGGHPTEFSVFDYGPLETALGHRQAVYECFESYMMTDNVLPHLWPNGGGGSYVINCLDRLEVSQDRVMLEGRGWNGLTGDIPEEAWMDGKAQ